MGPSGCGKTSLMRVIAGLWNMGNGVVRCGASIGGMGVGKPSSEMALFLPQRPYMVLGSLRDQMLYPTWVADTIGERKADTPSDDQLTTMLESVGLSYLLLRDDGLD